MDKWTSKIEDFLECAICLEQLDERSRVLPCQHTFCMQCLAVVVETKGYLQCPECRSNFANLSINELPKNVLLLRILEGLKSKRHSMTRENHSAAEKTKEPSKRLSAKLKCDTLFNQPAARGLHNFSSNEEGDLSFSKGDVITLLNDIDDNWLEGVLKGKRGSIPKIFVEILLPIPRIDDDEVKTPFAKASYSYDNKGESELISFKEGDILRVIKKVDHNWLEGILGGQYGIFPVNFMKLNKAAKAVMDADSSSSGSGSSSNSSDEDSENKQCRKSRRSPKSKNVSSRSKAQASKLKIAQKQQLRPPKRQFLSTNEQTKRHTIHVENPDEQQRQSRRALNLSDDMEQAQTRSRTQSQGRRSSESAAHESCILASSVVMNRNLRYSDDHLNCSVPCTIVPVTSTSGALTFSTARSTSAPSPPLGPGEIYTALFTYSPAQDDELALIQGDQYYVLEKHLDGWFKGIHIRSRQSGVFPGNYVKLRQHVTQQMLRNVSSSPSRNVIGYGSNPSSPTVVPGNGSAFNFPPRGVDTTEPATSALSSSPRRNGEGSSPPRNSGFALLKMLKKSKSKRPQPPTTPATSSSSSPPTSNQSPPSYYHSSMPGPAHHRLSRPSPMVPTEPPPPYTPSLQQPIISNVSQINTPQLTEKFRAVATYPANQENELSFRAGDVIYVTRKHVDGWFTGKSQRTGETGIFPSMFVDPCQ